MVPRAHRGRVRRYRPDRPVAAVSALAIRGDEVLLVHRLAEPYKGRWGLPGGAVELGEPARDAVVREAREETGLLVEPDGVVDGLDILVPGRGRPAYHFVLAVFRVRVLRGRLRAASDAGEARWVRLRDLKDLDVTDSTLRVIRTATGH